MEAGIVGLPNVGKSTLFNALTMSKAAQSANYPFCTIEPNEGMVSVPDGRLQRITKFIPPQKVIPAALKLVDIADVGKKLVAEPLALARALHDPRDVDELEGGRDHL
ncbi:MAG: GTPase, partial [Planctomycetota bacterium]